MGSPYSTEIKNDNSYRHIWSERNFDVDESARDLDIDTSLDIVELAVAEYEVELERFADSEHNILPQRAQRVRDLEGVIRGFESQSRGDVLNRLDPGLGQGTDGLELEDEIMPTTVIFFGVIIIDNWSREDKIGSDSRGRDRW